ncbi:MAG: M20/M25/M40 family metallo-hydrolase [Oscillospiraceae bacterium]|nr:M20/M25/M40 family metallo-hydrolase [Oscillospiraceae bacterium]
MRIEKEQAVGRFQEILRVQTVSRKDDSTDWSQFDAFLPKLRQLYPKVFQVCDCSTINQYGIILKWKGADSSLQPVILMAHHDVVPVEGQDWHYPPFGAEIHDGKIYARGTVDTKCILAAVLEAMEALIIEGVTPDRDVYFTTSNCEETAGDTTPQMVQWFAKQGIKPWFVLDEGGAILQKMPMGITNPFAMIGVSEKGLANVYVTATAKAGHASLPSKQDAPVKLVKALHRIEANPFPATLTPALQEMLKCFSNYVGGGMRFVFNNLWLFGPVVKKVMEGTPDTAAMIRTTAALTQLSGSEAINVLPEKASAGFSVRIAPQDSVASVINYLQKAVGDLAVVTYGDAQEPSPISDHNTKSYAYIKNCVAKVYPGVDSAPYVMNAATDSRHFAPICREVYRFAGFVFSDEQRASIHSADEYMPVDDYIKGVEFYGEFLKNLH